ncbi:hypothetical protein P8R33_09570 [Qipengyuania sp. XHP0211]|uniref:hypothetical protein n=1 Tax=Qipengyuania sp. XHP0211 TaxID=3038079 RepID=UPI00241C8158|nr:hypothetical protein [Qipengyuania sp. XHP0211]MDG5751353.1 hypothetical protein [Qipengyuania sp. XHP0211]
MSEPEGNIPLTKRQFAILNALQEAKNLPVGQGDSYTDSMNGWFLATQLLDKGLVDGGHPRPVLQSLCKLHLAESIGRESGRYFRITPTGKRRLDQGFTEADDQISVDTSSWTGVVEPIQVVQVLTILGEMEDVCERMTDNAARAQIMGLIRALELLVDLPNPPRQGIVSLVRDPAFANIVQFATFFAALIAAVKP